MIKAGTFIFSATLLLAALSTSVTAHADTLIIPVGQQAGDAADMERPKTGALRSEVSRQFGEPISKTAGKGNPPISSWEYKDFVVYFENDHVIHSVLKHRPYVD
ncbi:hypothetical protein [Cellvibrio polysaccharolyticus]|uniref:Phosphodiesterase n=1 Tax=Cellvibrio polysaccharolyticus TaxID=2082724 RepID=A0A928V276_9GAMM|nr:hypothetical protein [Cellvibrio polysaccharolyticus]MBE8717436.1 hypothetical protein [Cellvibrio polysaccharolyticus]